MVSPKAKRGTVAVRELGDCKLLICLDESGCRAYSQFPLNYFPLLCLYNILFTDKSL